MNHKNQHWIPQGYLKAWCDPLVPPRHEPYVWQFSKDGSSVRKKAPKNIFWESELYTLDGAVGRDLEVEHGLGDIESEFVKVREQKLSRNLPLTAEERMSVCAFVAAMQSRTPFQVDHWRSNWERVAEMGRKMQEKVDAGHPTSHSLPGSGPSFSQAEVERLATAERGKWVAMMIEMQLPILSEMNLSIFSSKDALGFITSDSPCVWYDPQSHLWPSHMRSPGLGKRTIEVTLPCSPSQMLALTWVLPPGPITIGDSLLHELNRRTRFHAREHFVARTNRTRPEWFEAKKRPDAG